MICVYFLWFHYWILKEWKAAKVANHHSVSAYWLFAKMISPLFDMYTGAMFIFSTLRFQNCASQEQAIPSRLGFYGSGLASLPSLLKTVKAGWLGSIRSEIFLEIPLHIISSLFSQFCLFQNAILHKILKLGFWNFKLTFLRMQFSYVATFSSLVLVISLS